MKILTGLLLAIISICVGCKKDDPAKNNNNNANADYSFSGIATGQFELYANNYKTTDTIIIDSFLLRNAIYRSDFYKSLAKLDSVCSTFHVGIQNNIFSIIYEDSASSYIYTRDGNNIFIDIDSGTTNIPFINALKDSLMFLHPVNNYWNIQPSASGYTAEYLYRSFFQIEGDKIVKPYFTFLKATSTGTYMNNEFNEAFPKLPAEQNDTIIIFRYKAVYNRN